MFSSLTQARTPEDLRYIHDLIPDSDESGQGTVTMGFTISVPMGQHAELAEQVEAFLETHPNWDFNQVMTEALRGFFAAHTRSWVEQIEYNETDGGAI